MNTKEIKAKAKAAWSAVTTTLSNYTDHDRNAPARVILTLLILLAVWVEPLRAILIFLGLILLGVETFRFIKWKYQKPKTQLAHQ